MSAEDAKQERAIRRAMRQTAAATGPKCRHGGHPDRCRGCLFEAVQKLRTEAQRLRKVLVYIASGDCTCGDDLVDLARETLDEKPRE